MNILLQPCSGKLAMSHFEDTIMNGVPLGYFDNKIANNELQTLRDLNTSAVKVWGFVPGKNTRDAAGWNKLEAGDLVLFSAKKEFFYMAVVHSKIHNKEIAEDLWGTDDTGRTWEYIFFIKEGKQISLPYLPTILVKADGTPYKSNHVVQGAFLLQGDNAVAMRKYLEEKEGASFDEENVEPTETDEVTFRKSIKDPLTVEDAQKELEKVSVEMKNAPVKERIKVAKMLVRNPKFARLVKEKAGYVCEVCGTAPFMQKNGLPYAEAHHKSELAKTKIDNPDDMICICPTCHKVVHFGTEEELKKRYIKKDGVRI